MLCICIKKEIPPRDLLDKYRIIIHGIIFNIGEAGIVKVKATNNVTWLIYSLSLIIMCITTVQL